MVLVPIILTQISGTLYDRQLQTAFNLVFSMAKLLIGGFRHFLHIHHKYRLNIRQEDHLNCAMARPPAPDIYALQRVFTVFGGFGTNTA